MAKQSSDDQGPVSPKSGKAKVSGGEVKGRPANGQPRLSTLNDQGANKLGKTK